MDPADRVSLPISIIALPEPAPVRDRPSATFGLLAIVVAALVAVAALAGIYDPASYARETAAWRLQAIAQDRADLAVAVPWLVACGALVLRGSRRARLPLAGCLAYVAYTYAIAAFAVRFNALFLVYVAILGLAGWSAAALLRGPLPPNDAFAASAPRKTTATLLIVAAAVFALGWLGEDVPALVRGEPPASLAEVALPSNPVHVLDLAFALPALAMAGIALARRRPASLALGAAALAFVALQAFAVTAIAVALPAADALLPTVLGGVAAGATYLLADLLRALRPV